MTQNKKKLAASKVSAHRDFILTNVEDTIAEMTPTQALDFLFDLKESIRTEIAVVEDEISSIRSDTPCTCSYSRVNTTVGYSRGYSVHTKKCAKSKAVK